MSEKSEENSMEAYLRQQIQDHEKRINTLERANLVVGHQVELLSEKVEGMKANFQEVQKTVIEEGEKNRLMTEKVIERYDSTNDKIWSQMERMEARDEAAAVREFETKRTKLQIFRDAMVTGGAFYLILQELVTRFL